MTKLIKFFLYLLIPTGAVTGVGFYQYSGAKRHKREVEERMAEINECSKKECCEKDCREGGEKADESCKNCCNKCVKEEKADKR